MARETKQQKHTRQTRERIDAKMGQDYFANLAKTTKSDARHCGGQITLHKCAKPEMRIFIRDNTRQFKAATFSDSAIRGNCARTCKKFYYEVGATVVKPYEVRSLARKSNYDMREFRKLMGARLDRDVCKPEAIELINAAAKYHNTETLGATRKEVPKGVKVYALK